MNADGPKLTPMYTPGFAPPELYSKTEALGPWTDAYSIGASIFCCMAGAPPQPADQRKEDKMEAHFAKLEGQLFAGVAAAGALVCLELDPLARPQSLFELQQSCQCSCPSRPRSPARRPWAGSWSALRGLVTA